MPRLDPSALERYRLGAGLSAKEVTRRSGLAPRTIHGLERGRGKARPGTVARYCEAVGITREQYEALSARAYQLEIFGQQRKLRLPAADWDLLDRMPGGAETGLTFALALLRVAAGLAGKRE